MTDLWARIRDAIWPAASARKGDDSAMRAMYERLRQRVAVQAASGYDAAEDTRWLENYYASGVSTRSANAELYAGLRQTIRNRARYELRNNSWARGMIDTKAQYIVGTGPRPQVVCRDREEAQHIEAMWRKWASREKLAQKLLLAMQQVEGDSGEAFIVLATKPYGDGLPDLHLRIVEADSVKTPSAKTAIDNSARYEDGISYDDEGEPTGYDVAKIHPGESYSDGDEFFTVNASDMIHLYRKLRPGQRRGIPSITPALPLFALLRRFSLSTIIAAESAANMAGMLQSDSDDPDPALPFETVDYEPGQVMVAPKGWKYAQLQPEHPSVNHEMFVKMQLNEISRCLQIPLNIAMLNSAGYNYASGRLDHQTFWKSLDIDHAWLASDALYPMFERWYRDADLMSIVTSRSDVESVSFNWDGHKHSDPQKEANADKIDLENQSTTLERIYAEKGLDYEEELRAANKVRMLQIDLKFQEELYRRELSKKYGFDVSNEPENGENNQENGDIEDDESEEPDDE